jgi:hypothetical protein
MTHTKRTGRPGISGAKRVVRGLAENAHARVRRADVPARAQPQRVARGALDKLGDARARREHVRRLLTNHKKRSDSASASLTIFRPARVRRERVGKPGGRTHVECGRLVTRPRIRRTITK